MGSEYSFGDRYIHDYISGISMRLNGKCAEREKGIKNVVIRAVNSGDAVVGRLTDGLY